MDTIIDTPRLTLTLIKTVERGQPELEWLHELHSNKETTWWSLSGQSKSVEDTENIVRRYFSAPTEEGEKDYKVVYAVHRKLPLSKSENDCAPLSSTGNRLSSTEFIGLVNLGSVGPGGLQLPDHLTLPASMADTTLTIQIAYYFLPKAWGSGYATEAVNAVLATCKRTPTFWAPYQKLYVRAIVNPENPPSSRVMDKIGMEKKGVFEWTGKAVFVAGKWRERDNILIYGMHLIE